jgi:hypothetical protein
MSYEDAKRDSPFFQVTVMKLVILTTLTWGFYFLVWAYLNWHRALIGHERKLGERALAQSEETAVRRRLRVEYFRWPGKLPEALRRGTNVLCWTHYSQRNITVSAPARVLHVKRYRSSFGELALVYIALRKYSRERSLKSVIRQIPEATFMKRIRSFQRVADRAVAARLASLWPTEGAGRPT